MPKKFSAAGIAKKFNKKNSKVSVTTLDSYEKLDIKNGTLDTTSATLNAIISGSVHGGMPIGRVTGVYGPSGCGKSFVVGRTVAEAQKMGYIPLIVDSEHAWHGNAEGYGLDIKECLKIEGSIIEDVRSDIVNMVKACDEDIANGLKLIVVIDSLGALRCAKEVRDVEEGNPAADMGQRSKAMKSMMNAVCDELGKRNITFIWTNHAIQNPGALHKTSIQKMPGGDTIIYRSDVIIGMRRSEIKNEKEDEDDESSKEIERNIGARIPIEAIKQRFIKPFLKGEMTITYKEGIKRYSGLFELGRAYDAILGDRSYQLPDGTKLGWKKNFINDDKIWKDVIIPVLDPIIQDSFGFGTSKTKKLLTETDMDGET